MQTVYQHSGTEDALYASWEASGRMRAESSSDKKPFTIVLPPPNVTGQLHLGHAAMLAIEDILIRYKKMKGYEALWVPGTDHAAIATENVVVKKLGLESREDMDRQDFLEETRKFAQEKHDTIVNQTKKMGAWLDWSREAYTLDEERNTAVKTMFEMMYEDGLIERGHRMINWSTGAQSVLSDDELEWEDQKEPFYYIQCGEFIIGTVRSETKCCDSPVILHPDGDYVRVRYVPTIDNRQQTIDNKDQTLIMSKHLFENEEERGKVLNLLEGEFELVEEMKGKDLEGQTFSYDTYAGKRDFFVMTDRAIDMKKGSGAMTISICHSTDDYEIAKRYPEALKDYYFEKIDKKGLMTSHAGPCEGMPISEARKKSAKIMKEQGILVGEDKSYAHRVPKCYRSNCVVEPMISPQWFVMVEKEFEDRFGGGKTTLKRQMQEAVRGGHIKIIPDRFNKTYFHWIDNLRDWCISRQIWWGHRIPVWYDEKGDIVAAGNVEEKDMDPAWTQDEDTLDTWFSSALWPFSTLGWPEKTPDLEKFYPNDVLETGWDIIFFWVARMIMFGRYATGQYPFHTTYLHGMVCDEHGKKMSKSKGNGIDPLEVIEEVGADAVRLSLVIGSTPGNPIPLGHNKIKGYRNFVNKLWNAGRFVKMQGGEVRSQESGVRGNLSLADRWILSRLSKVAKEVSGYLDTYQISSAGDAIYHFVWDEFCDWYLESSKINATPTAPAERGQQPIANNTLEVVFREILKLAHPLCPFVTESLWKEVYGEEGLLIDEAYPVLAQEDAEAESQFAAIQEIVRAVRKLRTDHQINPKEKIKMTLDPSLQKEWEAQAELLTLLAGLSEVAFEAPSSEGVRLSVSGRDIFVEVPVDEEAEKARLEKHIAELEKKKAALESRLSNPSYRDKAPAALVQQTEAELQSVTEELTNVEK